MQDMNRVKILSDILNTVSTINEYYSAAPRMHRTPMQAALSADSFGVRPGSRTRIYRMTPEEEEAEIKALEADSEAYYAAEIDGIF